jgi:hypothetical protein
MTLSRSDLPGYRPLPIPFHIDYEGWTRKEARAFFEWFVEQIDDRIDQLQRMMRTDGLDCSLDRSPESLDCVGEFLKRHARPRLFGPEERQERREALMANPKVPAEAVPVIEAISGGWTTDELSISLSVDVGMYLGEVLRAAHPSLRWELWTRKTVEYHMPVLTGFVNNVPLDPAGIAHVLALRFVKGEGDAGRLRELFDYWSTQVES